MEKPPKMFLLNEQQRDLLIKYLATKPYQEVGEAIPALLALPELPVIQPPPPAELPAEQK